MMRITVKGNDQNALKQMMKQIHKGKFPNFLISGNSLSSIEKLGLQIVSEAEKNESLNYKGIVKHFTIIHPYYENEQGAKKFLEHLKHSVSLAKDCYDAFSGIVLMDFEKDWAIKGYNDALSPFLNYVREHREISFIVLLPSAMSDHISDFYKEISGCGLWISIQYKARTANECFVAFKKRMEEKGYFITQEAKQLLLSQMKQRSEEYLDNTDLLDHLVEQVVFEREITGSKNRCIEAKDVTSISGIIHHNKTRTVGFAVDSKQEGERNV